MVKAIIVFFFLMLCANANTTVIAQNSSGPLNESSVEAKSFLSDINSYDFAQKNPKASAAISTLVNSEVGRGVYKKVFANDTQSLEILENKNSPVVEKYKNETSGLSLLFFIACGFIVLVLSVFFISKKISKLV